MSKKKVKLKGKYIFNRLTGISTPIGGVNWTPPADERDKAKRLLNFIEDRRALYHPFDKDIRYYIEDSIFEIRKRLTNDLKEINKSSILGESLIAMRAACRKFLDDTQKAKNRSKDYHISLSLLNSLAEFRTLCGIHVARLACAYDLELDDELSSILPPEPEDDLT